MKFSKTRKALWYFFIALLVLLWWYMGVVEPYSDRGWPWPSGRD